MNATSHHSVRTACIIAGLLLVITLSIGASRRQNANPALDFDESIFSRVRIIEFQNMVVRFDTDTGSLMRFSGNLGQSNASGTWFAFVRPVNGQTSGFLKIEEAGSGVFLIDAVTGDTWILRRTGNLGSWVKVKTLGS
jgi:hypothetical protein